MGLKQLEEQVIRLGRRVAVLENQLTEISKNRPVFKVDRTEYERSRLQHLKKILQRLGGEASLKEVSRLNSSITKAGTRAQLLRLVAIKDVKVSRRGVYVLMSTIKEK